ncbi:VOC family protein [Caldimonas thermodepolymerans]|uniref:Catechol 2,3-dioxygenase-like lactoylglutathione lyase family enzyme n=1 Tax=Caldimonas thermodepolymerans TaxID=215580 RepID=A0AA46DDJ3_9BURK|nr:VOC family protein [Caldimonas thermodepolymerans]TCP07123.1 catechol 2,3-dioxygenase-like lactoylglutathione lyase family enzyme [Caldimonas thermodepolymerans]UZG46635.1 VOC family protein [Caldimonas thermodepolymerans]
MLCKKLHHAAYRCRDAAETVKFYTEVLGLKFSHAMGEDHVPSTGKYSPHVHIFFEMEDGSSIAFFECPQDPGEPSGRDPGTPDWVQHFAFEVESVEVLLQAKADLEARGLKVIGPTNHDDFIESIYFFDPSGHRLELTARTCHDPVRLKSFEDEAPQVLALWEKTHDWSQRHLLFGSRSGYQRDQAANKEVSA